MKNIYERGGLGTDSGRRDTGSKSSNPNTAELDKYFDFTGEQNNSGHGKIIDKRLADKRNELLWGYRSRFTSPDGKLSYYMAVINTKGIFRLNDESGFYIEQTWNGKTTWDYSPFSLPPELFSSHKDSVLEKLNKKYSYKEIFSMFKRYAQQKIKNYHISGDKDVEYKNDKQKEAAEATPVEIFNKGGIINSILSFLNEKVNFF